MGCLAWHPSGFHYETNYQDIWVKGYPIVPGVRECELRFWAIYKALRKTKKPLKVLDIGANMGYFSIRLSEKIPGTYAMIEGHESTAGALLKICKLNENPSLVLLKRKLCLADLKALRLREKFDVILALSIIHHFDEPYNEVFRVLMSLGNTLIFEPPIREEETLNQFRIVREPIDLENVKKKLLIEVPTGSRYGEKWLRPTYLIDCTRGAPYVTIPGISAETFDFMNGIYPSSEEGKSRL